MTPERAEEVLKMSIAGRYVASCGPAGEEQIALKIIAEQRDRHKAALENIRDSAKDCPSCCSSEQAEKALQKP